jgi:hypothetical protein
VNVNPIEIVGQSEASLEAYFVEAVGGRSV